MYTLKRGNVIKIVDSQIKCDQLISEGFRLLTEPIPEDKAKKRPVKGGAKDGEG